MEIYLDYSATTPVCQEAKQAVVAAMCEQYGNPSSLHRKGFEAEQLLNESKKQLSTLLGCTPQELYVTSGATESNNLAIQGVAMARKRRGTHLITTTIEHPSVREVFTYLEGQGFTVTTIAPREDGCFHAVDFYQAVQDNTILVSAMLVNNETGLQLPIAEIAAAVKRKNPDTLVHTDAVQGFLKVPFQVKRTQVDLLSASGHKLYAPKGVGLLYVAKGVRLNPLFYGGGQQNGIRPGTDNVALFAGFAASATEYANHAKEHTAHYQQLKQHFCERVASIPEIALNSTPQCVPYILNFSVEKLRSEVLLHFLESKSIYVSSGSACSKGAKSTVLLALGLPSSRVDTAIRISFSPQTTMEQLDQLVDALQQGLATLAKLK